MGENYLTFHSIPFKSLIFPLNFVRFRGCTRVQVCMICERASTKSAQEAKFFSENRRRFRKETKLALVNDLRNHSARYTPSKFNVARTNRELENSQKIIYTSKKRWRRVNDFFPVLPELAILYFIVSFFVSFNFHSFAFRTLDFYR